VSVLVVGTVAFDDIETPSGRAEAVLGGSATYFSLAASCFAPVRLVGSVGEDFPMEALRRFEARGLDLEGIEVVPGGRTFRWAGRYAGDMNSAETLKTELNVLATFRPRLPEAYRDTPFVFLANTHPAVQAQVLDQVRKPVFVLADTMNLWIEHERPGLLEVLKRVDGLLLNDGEARQLTGERNLIAAGRRILDMGPRVVVVKKGEHGSFLFSAYQFFALPAYPLAAVTDPTGAGDSFAGGLVGSLARSGAATIGNIKRGMVHGTVTASFAVERFGTDGIAAAGPASVEARYAEFLQFVGL
jgi:sugar/nucleoside kinase (ribokinase family)